MDITSFELAKCVLQINRSTSNSWSSQRTKKTQINNPTQVVSIIATWIPGPYHVHNICCCERVWCICTGCSLLSFHIHIFPALCIFLCNFNWMVRARAHNMYVCIYESYVYSFRKSIPYICRWSLKRYAQRFEWINFFRSPNVRVCVFFLSFEWLLSILVEFLCFH